MVSSFPTILEGHRVERSGGADTGPLRISIDPEWGMIGRASIFRTRNAPPAGPKGRERRCNGPDYLPDSVRRKTAFFPEFLPEPDNASDREKILINGRTLTDPPR
jgi:hypothetical protein